MMINRFVILFSAICLGNSITSSAQQIMTEDGIEYILFKDYTATVSKVHYYSGWENITIEIPSQISDSNGYNYMVTTFGNDAIVFDHEWHCLNLEDYDRQDDWYQDNWTLENYPSQLDSITLPETLTKIGKLAFAGCNKLSSIYIPENVSFVDSCAFIGCNNLKDVHTPNIRKWKEINFTGTGRDCIANPLFYAHRLFEDGEKINEIHLQNNSFTDIGDYSFHGWDGKAASFDVGVEKIGMGAFSSCPNLESISILSYCADSIGALCFDNCTNLKRVNLPTSLKKIGNYAFQCCSSLTNINLPYLVASIGRCAFNHCYALESIQLPANIMTIECGTFRLCFSLNNVNIPPLVTKIGEEAFYGCSSLSEMKIPNNVLTIERAAFNNCQSLRLITFEDSDTDLTYDDVLTLSMGHPN